MNDTGETMRRWIFICSGLLGIVMLFSFASAQSIGPNPLPSGGAPGGAAGGSLSGTYPNPSLATAQPDPSTWASTQTFTLAPVFTDASGSRTALGLGTAATQATGTSGAALPFLNGNNTWGGTNIFGAMTATTLNLVDAGVATSQVFSGTNAGTTYLGSGAVLRDSSLGLFANPSVTANTYFGVGGSSDLFLSRSAAGVARFGTSSSNSSGSVIAAAMTATTLGATGLPLDTGIVDSSVCVGSTGTFYKGTGIAGICLGTSSMRFKERIHPAEEGLAQIVKLEPKSFFYRKGWGDDGAREMAGFMAEDVANVLPKLVGRDAAGQPNTVDLVGMIPFLVRAIQEQQKQIEALNQRNAGSIEVPPNYRQGPNWQ